MSKRKNTQMSDTHETASTDTAAKARKSFVRGPQKVWAVVTVKDENGNELDMRAGKGYEVSIELSKDQSGIITKLLDGAQAFVAELEVPKAGNAEDATA